MKLEDLKVGDEVYYTAGRQYCIGKIIKVIKITSTMIICEDNLKFRKINGVLVGNTDSWCFPEIKPATDELRNKIKHYNLSSQLNDVNFKKLNLEQLREIKKIINKEGGKL